MQQVDCRIVVLRYDVFPGWVNGKERTVKQVADIVEKESKEMGERIFVVGNVEGVMRQEREVEMGSRWVSGEVENEEPVYKLLENFFVENGTYYHVIDTVDN